MTTLRDIQLKICLAGGHEHAVTLREDAPELLTLFTALSTPGTGNQFVQLPLDGGRAAWSFQTSQLVSIMSEPPVVMDLNKAPVAAAPIQPGQATQLRRPQFVVIDDFLSPLEHSELLAFALISEEQFEAGTVTTYQPEIRQNLVMLRFGETVHSRLIQNRLLVWFPLLAKTFGMSVFPLGTVESHLTATGDGQYFKVHCDDAPDVPRVLSCVYYLHREPRGFAGGELRLYDSIEAGNSRRPAETFSAVEPVANRLVVFPSEEFHEAMPVRCPSKEFADSRFAITSWLHRSTHPDPEAAFGWGHFHCGVIPQQFSKRHGSGGSKS